MGMVKPKPMASELRSLLARELADPGTSWSLGEFGALGEFHHDRAPKEVAGLALRASHGSLRIDARECQPLAYETISGRPGLWLHGLALCLPKDAATMSERRVITYLGFDQEADREEDRFSPLFDLGLGLMTVDFCVRTVDPAIVAALHRACGTSILEDATLFSALRKANPHRVLVSRIARMEVRSPIPEPHGRPIAGPHTHLLPDLLRRQRAHSATLPIPEGLLPALYMYPPHPVQDSFGRERPFQAAHHLRFQALMVRYGARQQLSAKRDVMDSWRAGKKFELPDDRHARLAARVTLRQIEANAGAFAKKQAAQAKRGAIARSC